MALKTKPVKCDCMLSHLLKRGMNVQAFVAPVCSFPGFGNGGCSSLGTWKKINPVKWTEHGLPDNEDILVHSRRRRTINASRKLGLHYWYNTEDKKNYKRRKLGGTQTVQPCWIVVPPTIHYYNQTTCLTSCSKFCEWLLWMIERALVWRWRRQCNSIC